MEDTHDKSTGMAGSLLSSNRCIQTLNGKAWLTRDSANDIPMLEKANHALIIPINPMERLPSSVGIFHWPICIFWLEPINLRNFKFKPLMNNERFSSKWHYYQFSQSRRDRLRVRTRSIPTVKNHTGWLNSTLIIFRPRERSSKSLMSYQT